MKKRKYYDGYLTVEATFLFPVMFMILLLLIYWGFFCYDKSVSIQCCYLAALRGSNQWEMNDERTEAYALEQLESLTDETLLFMKKGDVYADVGLLEIKAGIKGKMDILFSGLRGDSMNEWLTESEKKAYRLKPASFIRKYRIFGEE